MKYEMNDVPVLVQQTSVGIQLVVTADSSDREFSEAAVMHCSEEAPDQGVDLSLSFPLSSILDVVIDSNAALNIDGNPVCFTLKPKMDEVRNELVGLIRRIDSIKYSQETSCPKTA